MWSSQPHHTTLHPQKGKIEYSLSRHSKSDPSLYSLLIRQLLITLYQVAWNSQVSLSLLTASANPDNEAEGIKR